MQKTTFWKYSKDFCMRPEILELSTQLTIPVYAAGALVALLYGWGIANADDNGSINDFTAKAIEDACMWDGDRGALLSALHTTGILVGDVENRADENSLRIGSWDMVAEEILRERRASRERQQRYRERRKDTADITRYESCDVTPPKNKEHRTKNKNNTPSAAESSTPRTRFSPPGIAEIAAYMRLRAKEKNLFINPDSEAERFADYYNANGWKVGKNPMKDWKAAVRNWLSRNMLVPIGAQSTHTQHRNTSNDVDDLQTLYR